MLTSLQKWGNSQGIRINKDILRKSGISLGDSVEVFIEKGRIIVKPVSKVRRKYNLKDLASKMPRDYQPHAFDWGTAYSKEVW
jgi:antitoxin MazE